MRKLNFKRSILNSFAVAVTLIIAWSYAAQSAEPVRPTADAMETCHDEHMVSGHSGHGASAASAVRSDEHSAVMNLAPACLATDVAVTSGDWSSPATWRSGSIPGQHARVDVPEGMTVTVDKNLGDQAMEWVRVDGRLAFAPDRDTALRLETMIVSTTGELEIGSEARPITDATTAKLVFAPRSGRNVKADPFDLAGGLIAEGTVTMHGARKTAYLIPRTQLRKGLETIEFPQPVQGWKAGDQLLVPGTSAAANEDERPHVAAVLDQGLRIALDAPLRFDHPAPAAGLVPVANLFRNIEISSADAAPLSARGHVMIMHNQTGSVIDGAAFRDLGRTDARRTHTRPELDAAGNLRIGSDDNTIGRYAVHFHIVSGASIDTPPQLFRNSVIVGSPKHGLVNHGGNVVAEDNVTYDVTGSHFFTENGTEIGAFRRNLAVHSAGSNERIRARDISYDFGHGGHGFWLQSAGVELADNFAFGHAEGGIVLFGYPFVEGGQPTFFDGRNVGNPTYADSLGRINISSVNFHLMRNVVAASKAGIEIWNHKIYANHDEISTLDGATVWSVNSFAVMIPYAKNIALRHLKLYGRSQGGDIGLGINTMTENILLDDIEVRGFQIGLQVSQRGHNVIRNAHLNNTIDLEIATANMPGRSILLDNVSFDGDKKASGSQTLSLKDLVIPENADYAMVFENDQIVRVDREFRYSQIFFPSQQPSYVPFKDNGPEALRALTSRQIDDQYGLAPGGLLAPEDAKPVAGSNAVAKMLTTAEAVAMIQPFHGSSSDIAAMQRELYPMASRHFVNGEGDHDSVGGRWAVVKERSRQMGGNGLVFVSQTPPKFLLMPALQPTRIHPDDIQYGYRVMGMVVDKIGDRIAMRAFSKEFYNLVVDPDGYVRISFTVANMSGIEKTVDMALQVTDQAVRRGSNLNFFVQRNYCGECGYDILYQEANKLFAQNTLP